MAGGFQLALKEPFAGGVLGDDGEAGLDIRADFEGQGEVFAGFEAEGRGVAGGAEEDMEFFADGGRGGGGEGALGDAEARLLLGHGGGGGSRPGAEKGKGDACETQAVRLVAVDHR